MPIQCNMPTRIRNRINVLYIEMNYSGKEVQQAHMQLAKQRKQWRYSIRRNSVARPPSLMSWLPCRAASEKSSGNVRFCLEHTGKTIKKFQILSELNYGTKRNKYFAANSNPIVANYSRYTNSVDKSIS